MYVLLFFFREVWTERARNQWAKTDSCIRFYLLEIVSPEARLYATKLRPPKEDSEHLKTICDGSIYHNEN